MAEPVGGVRLGERRLAELPGEDDLEPPVLPDDLGARTGLSEDHDEDRVRLLADRVSDDGLLGGPARAGEVPAGEPMLGHRHQRVLVPIGEALPLRREAVVSERLHEVAAVQLDGPLGAARAVVEAALEVHRHRPRCRASGRMPIDSGRMSRTVAGSMPARDEAVPDEPERLPQHRGRRGVGLGPEVGGDRLARPRPTGEDQLREQGGRVAAAERDGGAAGRADLEGAEQVDPDGGATGGFAFRHACVPAS